MGFTGKSARSPRQYATQSALVFRPSGCTNFTASRYSRHTTLPTRRAKPATPITAPPGTPRRTCSAGLPVYPAASAGRSYTLTLDVRAASPLVLQTQWTHEPRRLIIRSILPIVAGNCSRSQPRAPTAPCARNSSPYTPPGLPVYRLASATSPSAAPRQYASPVRSVL